LVGNASFLARWKDTRRIRAINEFGGEKVRCILNAIKHGGAA